jgi:nucleotide-binding universal stress UspA family protein
MPFPTGRRIVVGYDGSDTANRALAASVRASSPEGSVTVVAVHTELWSGGGLPEALDEPGPAPSALLAAARARLPEHLSTELVERSGDPAHEILEAARTSDADLIIVGRRGRSFVSRTLMGSVAARVAELASCDVLIVA